jgi:hypothetical protein
LAINGQVVVLAKNGILLSDERQCGPADFDQRNQMRQLHAQPVLKDKMGTHFELNRISGYQAQNANEGYKNKNRRHYMFIASGCIWKLVSLECRR